MITTLPSEIVQNIVSHLYAPLRMTQADRFAWNIFSSFGDNPPSRRQGLADLVALGATCRALWSEVRPSLFRCIRVADDEHLEAVIAARDDWAIHVRSIVIDMSLFESDERQTWDRGRNPWLEVKALHQLAAALPGLEHLSFFADGSDDITLSLFFGAETVRRQIAPQLKSFGWRARSETPPDARTFSATSMFVSFAEFLKDCRSLGCIVLDCNAEALAMSAQDLDLVLSSLRDRRIEVQQDVRRDRTLDTCCPKLTLMLCGLMSRWRPSDADLDAAESHPAHTKTKHQIPGSGTETDGAKERGTQESGSQLVTVLSQGYDKLRPWVNSSVQSLKAKSALVPYSDKVHFDVNWDARVTLHRKPGIKDHASNTRGFLGSLAGKMGNVREIFLDRPSIEDDKDLTLADQIITALLPLAHVPHLRVLQVGGYPLDPTQHTRMIEIVIKLCPEIMVCGWWSKDEDVVWYAIWRDRHRERIIDTYLSEAAYSEPGIAHSVEVQDLTKQLAMPRYLIKPLGEGELFALEAEQAAYERWLSAHYRSTHHRAASSPESRVAVV